MKIDLNHPLAGKKLNFKGYIIENREATMDEIKTMLSHMNGGDCGGDCGGCEGGCGHHDHEDGCCGHHEHKGGCCGHHH
jgi:FKBP-type peptidyl-prolyl cis-trans isomerase SlyD